MMMAFIIQNSMASEDWYQEIMWFLFQITKHLPINIFKVSKSYRRSMYFFSQLFTILTIHRSVSNSRFTINSRVCVGLKFVSASVLSNRSPLRVPLVHWTVHLWILRFNWTWCAEIPTLELVLTKPWIGFVTFAKSIYLIHTVEKLVSLLSFECLAKYALLTLTI